MKKKIFLVGIIAIMGLGEFLVSCSKDDDGGKTCTCIEVGYSGSRQIDPSSYGTKNCSDLELKLKTAAAQSGYNSSFSCH